MSGTTQLWTLIGQSSDKAVSASAGTPFYMQGWFLTIITFACLAALWWLGHKIAKGVKMPEYGTRLGIIFLSAAVSGIFIFNGVFKKADNGSWKFTGPKMGVDLRGGVNIIGQMNLSELNSEDALQFGGGDTITAQQIIPNLLRRVDPSGTNEIMIRPLGSDKIEVTIPDVSLEVAEETWYRLSKTGHLQFRIAADKRFHQAIIAQAEAAADKGDTSRTLYSGKEDDEERKIVARWYNLARFDRNPQDDPDKLMGIKYIPQSNQLVRDKKTGRLLNLNSFPIRGNSDEKRGYSLAKLLKKRGISTPQILMAEPTNERGDVQGKHLTGVRSNRDETGRPSVNFDLNSEGAKRMSFLTTVHKPKGESRYLLGIVLDNEVHSAPTIESPIHGGGRITGSFSKQEIDDLIINLRSGKIDVALNKKPLSMNYIKSSLGEELQQKGFYAIGASFLLVLGFMVFYYRFAGIVASLALLLNLALILGLIMAIRQPLTLTGLAGLVLTVGMSVDANVLIFERIREELAKDASLRMAIRNGFDKATVTIVDANLTTLITALILYVIGTEQIKGFAVTLILGILMSMFTAIYCSRSVFDIFERRRWISKLNMMALPLGRKSFDFLGKRAITTVLSMILIIAGLVGVFSLGAKILDHDLRGGSTAQVVFNESMNRKGILETLNNLGKEHNGEKLEYTVAQIGDADDNVFKIDSNLPPYDNPKLPKWDELDEVLEEAFGTKLKHNNVEVGPISVMDEGVKQSQGRLNRPSEPELPTSQVKPGFWNNVAPGLAHNIVFGPMTILQDPEISAEPAIQQAEIPAVEIPSVEIQEGTKQVEMPIGETPDPELPEAPQLEMPDPESPQLEIPESSQLEMPDDALPGIGSGSGESVDQGPKSFSPKVAKFTLEFDNEISGKGIKTLLIQAAERIDRDIEDTQISVTPSQIASDTDVDSTTDRKWTVELQVSDQAAAKDLLDAWSSSYNASPYFPVKGGVGGQIASQAQWQAIAAIVASLLGIIAYVWIRFQNVAFGLAAVVALVHDVLIVLGAIALSHYLLAENFKISLPVIAALLTIIGYSLNDTIVVFDRIREVRGKRHEMTAEMINSSISQTLSRTILTSLTTFIVVFILFMFGGDAIHGFAFALVIGVIVGTYSSIFIASPTLLWLMNRGFSPEYDEHGNPIKKAPSKA